MAVLDVQILARQSYEGGTAFGEAGPYERLDLLVTVGVDPADGANAFVADLDLASRGDDGLVRFEIDACLLQPEDPRSGNGCLLTSVVNRGRMDLVPFSFPPRGMSFAVTERVDPGDAFLLQRGWSVLFCGWQWDVVRRPGRLGAEVPLAVDAEAKVTVEFQPNVDRAAEHLGHWPWHPRPGHPDRTHRAYPVADVADPDAVLTERDWPGGPRRVVPRDRWRFARPVGEDAAPGTVDGPEVTNDERGLVANAHWVWSADGFRAGKVYEVVYRTLQCPLAGLGLVALRDLPAFLRHGSAAAGNPSAGRVRHTFAWGVSQTGRFLRQFLAEGANVDEAGRRVHDGMFVQVAGARRGEFNHRGAQPSVQYVRGPAQDPPFRHDPGLLDRQRARGGVPKIVEVNTANEYWRSEAARLHLDPEAGVDLDVPPDVRLYALAGCQHVSGMVALDREPILLPEARAANWINQVSYTAILRGLLVDLQRWVVDGIEPPPSTVPRFDEGTARVREAVLAAMIARPLPDLELPAAERLPTLGRAVVVSAVDGDGNEIGGVQPPDVAVPLATHLGWNVRGDRTGGAGQLIDMLGSSLPFAADAGDREAGADPRPSIAERYRDRDAYLAAVHAAVHDLVARRFLLPDDVDVVVRTSGRLYDLAQRPPAQRPPAHGTADDPQAQPAAPAATG
jgi:hypothetical protein